MFMLNKIHYARYGSYLDENYPGAQEEIERKGLSVRRNNLGIGQETDLAGEQTFMKHAKTAGMYFITICQRKHTKLLDCIEGDFLGQLEIYNPSILHTYFRRRPVSPFLMNAICTNHEP